MKKLLLVPFIVLSASQCLADELAPPMQLIDLDTLKDCSEAFMTGDTCIRKYKLENYEYMEVCGVSNDYRNNYWKLADFHGIYLKTPSGVVHYPWFDAKFNTWFCNETKSLKIKDMGISSKKGQRRVSYKWEGPVSAGEFILLFTNDKIEIESETSEDWT